MKIRIPVIILTMINFGILCFILYRFLFNPVNKIIDSRKKDIEDNIKKAEEDKETASSLKMEEEKILKETKEKGTSLVEEYKLKGENLSKEIINKAHTESDYLIEISKKEIEREREKAKEHLKKETIDLAILLSSKALDESIDEKKHRKLIENFISKVGS